MTGHAFHTIRRVALATLVVSVAVTVPGWWLGYRTPQPYLMFWALNTLLFGNVALLLERIPSDSRHERLLQAAILAFALVATAGLVLGGLGRITPFAYGVLMSLLLAGVVTWSLRAPATRGRATSGHSKPLLHPVLIIAGPLLALVVCFGLTHPPVGYDSLTYHLFFPARWLQEHCITIIPTPFGDQAPAYSPSNGELAHLWLMLPFHGDLLARVGQFPFYVLSAIATHGIARRLGATSSHALYGAGFFLLARPIIDQAVGADIDLVFAAGFLTATYFALTAAQTGRRSDLVLWGISLGLCIGTKVLGVTFGPLLLPLVLAPRIRWRAGWILPGIVVLAAPWYIRNWIVAGSPLYPVGLTIAGVTLAPGAWTRAVFVNNWAHLTDLRLLPGLLWHDLFGASLSAVALPIAAAGAAILAWTRRWMALAITVALPLVLCSIYWYVLPFNDSTDTRFLFSAVGLTMALVPAVFQLRAATTPLHVALAAALIWLAAIGVSPLVPREFLLLYAALACVVLVGLIVGRRLNSPRHGTAMIAAMAALIAAVFVMSIRRCPDRGCELVDVATFNRPTLFAGWDWIDTHAQGGNVAYSGNNVPYRLMGSHLTNRVFYVSIDTHPDWRYHDYEQADRARPDYRPPERPNPPLFRHNPSFEAWRANLTQRGIRYIFLTRLSVLMEDDYQRDASGFPIEASWSDAHPEMFERVFDNPEVRIYAVR